MKTRTMLPAIALGIALGVASVTAAEPKPAPSQEEMKLAFSLLEAAGTPDVMEQTLQHTLNVQLQNAPELLPFRGAFESFLRRTISYEAQKDELARVYLELYSQDEIRELIRFYQTPIGRKKAAADAKISVHLAEAIQRKMTENMPQFQQEMQKLQQLQQSGGKPVGPRLPAPAQP